jgi:hypothetical protein
MANLRGLILGLAGSRVSGFWVQAATIVLSGLVLALVASWAFREQGGGNALPMAITTTAIVSYYLLIHDMSILLIPIVVTLNRFIGAEATGDRTGRMMARASALLFVAPVCFSYIPDHFFLVALPLLAFLFAILAGWKQWNVPTREVRLAPPANSSSSGIARHCQAQIEV